MHHFLPPPCINCPFIYFGNAESAKCFEESALLPQKTERHGCAKWRAEWFHKSSPAITGWLPVMDDLLGGVSVVHVMHSLSCCHFMALRGEFVWIPTHSWVCKSYLIQPNKNTITCVELSNILSEQNPMCCLSVFMREQLLSSHFYKT